MRRLAILFLAVVLVAGFLPLPAHVSLVCQMTGGPMTPVSVEDSPRSCCAVRLRQDGNAELANPSCCTLKITPGRASLPGMVLADASPALASLPDAPLVLPLPDFLPVVSPSLRRPSPLRGPPRAAATPRAPPFLS